MRICIDAKTNSSVPYLNEMHIRTADGREVIIDRDQDADFWSNATNTIGHIVWRGIYQWDGEKENYDLSKDLFRGAVIEEIEVEDDAPKGYYFDPFACSVSGFKDDPKAEVIMLPIIKKSANNTFAL